MRVTVALAVPDPHALPALEVARALEVDPAAGLSTAEAARRAALTGPNELEPAKHESIVRMVVDAATEPFVILLAVAGILAVWLNEVRDGLLVLVGLVPIVGADVVTEYRGQRALEALREASAPAARVRRDGLVDDIPAADLVPGDIVLLRSGDVVPADLRLIRAEGLQLDRSLLTGESLPEPGSTEPDPRKAPLTDRRSIAFAGTSAVAGRGEGIVVAIGARQRGRRRSPAAWRATSGAARPSSASWIGSCASCSSSPSGSSGSPPGSASCAAIRSARTSWPASRRRSRPSPRSRPSSSRSSSAWAPSACCAAACWCGTSTPRRRSARWTSSSPTRPAR